MAHDAVQNVEELVQTLSVDETEKFGHLSLEQLSLLILSDRLNALKHKTENEFKELKARQDQVSRLQKVLKAINRHTSEKGELNIKDNDELKALITEAKELGADIDDSKSSYSSAERDRLVENIRMTVDDLNVKNDMQIQTVTRLTNERYESYQLARAIMKPLHDDKLSKTKAVAGR